MKNKRNLKIFNFKKGIGIENATRNQQPSTIEIKRIEKVKDQKIWKQEGYKSLKIKKYGNKKEIVTT